MTQNATITEGEPPSASGGEAPALRVEHLSKTYLPGTRLRPRPPVVAVDDVSFALPERSTLAIVGESGSGKTTVARMLMGLEVPTSGSIEFQGRPLSVRTAKDRRSHARSVQMVFQNPYRSLDPRQKVGASLEEVLTLHTSLSASERRTRSRELFELVRLDARLLDSLPSDLSGGQRQRVCIARALACEARTIVFDEAVAALDVLVQAQVLNLLADLQAETHVSYLFVTHDLAVVRQVADDLVVMQGGRIVERGVVDAVLDAPEHPYTQRLLAAVPREGWTPGLQPGI
ncbi:MAG: ATP-binding cassette domain-containing protein [Nocardioides sp.]|uniref:ABC transporter ATP-binding protein n=1 Tax=Nocardioides sp. TaxID=35761 RepID=UPI0032645725